MPISPEVATMRENNLLTDEDLTKLAELEANMIEASSEDLGTMLGVIAGSLRPELFDEEDFQKVAQLLENELDSEGLEKTAAKFLDITGRLPTMEAFTKYVGETFMKHKGKIAPAFLSGMLLALGGQSIIGTLSQKSALSGSLEKIKARHPELKADKMTDEHFEALATFSPSLAKNPVVASSLLLKMKQWGTIDHKTIQDLILMERNLQSPTGGMGGIHQAIQTTGAIHKLLAPGTTLLGEPIG